MNPAPPISPLYPEPQPLGQGRYILDPSSYHKLPIKFSSADISSDSVIVVHSSGALNIEPLEPFYFHASQMTHFSGRGEYLQDWWYVHASFAPHLFTC